MNKDDSIIIERVANGYQVRPATLPGELVCVRDTMVFQDMGYASGTGELGVRECLLTFIAKHFSEGDFK